MADSPAIVPSGLARAQRKGDREGGGQRNGSSSRGRKVHEDPLQRRSGVRERDQENVSREGIARELAAKRSVDDREEGIELSADRHRTTLAEHRSPRGDSVNAPRRFRGDRRMDGTAQMVGQDEVDRRPRSRGDTNAGHRVLWDASDSEAEKFES